MKKLLFRILSLAALSALLLTAAYAEENLYEDSFSGVSFSVPAGWELQEIYDEDIYNVTFSSPEFPVSNIVYWCADLCEENESVRPEVSNEFITKEDAAEIFEIAADQIEVVDYNGSSYFCMEVEYELSMEGMDGTYTVTQLSHFRDGWMYQFEFLGTNESEGFPDFESLMNTVEYPSFAEEPAESTALPDFPNPFEEAVAPYAPKDPLGDILNAAQTDTGDETVLTAEEDRAGTAVGLVVLSCLAIFGFGAVIGAAKKKKQRQEILTREPRVKHMSAVCPDCGIRLPAGSKVCHLCGRKIGER